MSKIGRKPIEIKNIKVDIKDNVISYKAAKASGSYTLPKELSVVLDGQDSMKIIADKTVANINQIWGLHRAKLANELIGASTGFEKKLQIVGLGFKVAINGKKAVFSLGFSHKIDFTIPDEVTVEADAKTGQQITVKGISKDAVGLVSDQIRALRPPEPYKGTGIRLTTENVRRKAGKTKNT